MRLTIIIITCCLIQVNAAGYGQKISLKKNNASLESIFEEIRQQSGYDFFYDSYLNLGNKKISIELKHADITEALNKVLYNQPFKYTVDNKTIIITPKEPSFLDKVADVFEMNKQDLIRGRVVDEDGNPISGATLTEKGTDNRAAAGRGGDFMLTNVAPNATIVATYVGFVPAEYKITDKKLGIVLVLKRKVNKLEEVEVIVSTGYQNLPKERATGSFEKIDNELFNRSVSTDVLSRLEGITNSVLLNKTESSISSRRSSLSQLSIRGTSTLFGPNTPLIVVDNFPYEGDVNNINPNDVENITILKDAAAASIWGTKAGNGVIVINTKKGKYNNPLAISLNSNIRIKDKPDLFQIPVIKSSDYIDVEKFLFDKDYFQYMIDDMWSPISPVVQILDKQQKHILSDTEAENQINALRQVDARNDLLKYIYRKQVNQQYALNINGGNNQVNYILSGGLDKNLNDVVTSSYSRISMRSAVNFKPIKNLEIQASMIYTETKDKNISNQNPISYSAIGKKPYTRLVDDNGQPAEIDISGLTYLSRGFRDNPGTDKLLDYHYKPLAELDQSSNTAKVNDILINLGASYKVLPILNFSLKYQYQRSNNQNIDWSGLGSYYTRDLINYYSSWTNTSVTRGIPVGDIMATNIQQVNANSGRAQLDLNKTWADAHEITALAGLEVRQNKKTERANLVYGYNGDILTAQQVDYVHPQTVLNGNDSPSRIPDGIVFRDLTDRYTSIFANAAYSYQQRYIVSASARKDATNFFGANSNKKGQPLWSAGLSWILSKENFYKSKLFPFIKLRATYGSNGNAVNTVFAKAVISYRPTPNTVTGLINGFIPNPPNPDLKWETVKVVNLGLDFSGLNNRLSGSIEYFDKRASDLISMIPINPSIGFSNAQLNTSNVHGKGLDVSLNSTNINAGKFNWTSNFLFTYNRNIVSRYLYPQANLSSLVGSGLGVGKNPVEGRDAFGLYTYKFAGLDPADGSPRGYVNGEISKNYAAMVSPTNINDLDYHGSLLPVYYGAFRNSFSWKSFTLSANMQYKFGYKIMRVGINYYSLFYNNGGIATAGSADFAKRWQKPGDENITDVPSMVYPGNFNRDRFYVSSSTLVENGAHIRLQNINLTYNLSKPVGFIRNVKLYANLDNVGIIWRANKVGLDPDFTSYQYPNPKSITLGINADF